MNVSLYYSIKYFKNNNCFPSIFFFQLITRHLQKDFQRNLQDSIQMPDITKTNSSVHFILRNTGHTWRRLTVYVCAYQSTFCGLTIIIIIIFLEWGGGYNWTAFFILKLVSFDGINGLKHKANSLKQLTLIRMSLSTQMLQLSFIGRNIYKFKKNDNSFDFQRRFDSSSDIFSFES